MSVRDVFRSLVPIVILDWNRRRKKTQVRNALAHKKNTGAVWTKERLVDSLRSAGVQYGVDLLVHSAMSRIGYVEGGPKTVVDALREVIGPEANLLMPSSPVTTLQANTHKRSLVCLRPRVKWVQLRNTSDRILLPNAVRTHLSQLLSTVLMPNGIRGDIIRTARPTARRVLG